MDLREVQRPLEQLLEKTERYCVVLQTLEGGPRITTALAAG
jgi:hypothetical protein